MTDVTSSRLASASTITGVLPPSSSDGLAMLALQYSYGAPCPHTARQGDHADGRVLAKGCRDVVLHGQDIQDASRQTRLLGRCSDLECRGRRVVTGPHYHTVACDQCRGNLAQQGVYRVVERNQASHDPDGFALQQDGFIGRIAGDHFAFDAAGPFGVVARDGGSIDRLVGGVLQTFTRLARQGLTYDGRTLFQGIGEGTQVLAPLDRW